MKIRNGFVSNSSSSSFVIGIGKVKDLSKFVRHCYDIGVMLGLDNNHNIDVFQHPKSTDVRIWILDELNDRYEVQSFRYDIVLLKKSDLKEGDSIVCFNFTNNEGDSEFTVYDEKGEYDHLDYRIGTDRLPEEQMKLYELMFDREYVEIGEAIYGAARNG